MSITSLHLQKSLSIFEYYVEKEKFLNKIDEHSMKVDIL